MACKDCTCYVDGHSYSGKKLGPGKGLCTMHDQDVLANGDCSSYVSIDGITFKNVKQANVPSKINSKITDTQIKPRRGMKICATISFVFAVIYGLMSIGLDIMIFAFCAFCAILGIMFLILSKSPKQSPYLFGRQSGMKKSSFVLMCIAAAFCSVIVIATLTGNMEVPPTDNNDDSSEIIKIENDSHIGIQRKENII